MRDSLFAYSEPTELSRLGKRVSWTVCVLAVGLMTFLLSSSVAAENGATSDAKVQVTPKVEGGTGLVQSGPMGRRGERDGPKRQRYYDRFPAKAEGTVRGAVWNLSRHSAGIAVRFATDSKQVRVRYRLFEPAIGHVAHAGDRGQRGRSVREARGTLALAGCRSAGKARGQRHVGPGARTETAGVSAFICPFTTGLTIWRLGSTRARNSNRFRRERNRSFFTARSITQGGLLLSARQGLCRRLSDGRSNGRLSIWASRATAVWNRKWPTFWPKSTRQLL